MIQKVGNMMISSDIIAKNINYIGGYLVQVVESVSKYKERETLQKLNYKKYFGKRFDVTGNSPVELLLEPVMKLVEGVKRQPSKQVKFGSNDITVFAYSIANDNGSDAKAREILWLPYHLEDFDNVDQLHKELFPMVRDLYAAINVKSMTLDVSNEFGYQQTMISLGAYNENVNYCNERGLEQVSPNSFQEQFALSELFAEINAVAFCIVEDAVNGKIDISDSGDHFVGIVEYVAETQKSPTNIYSGGFGHTNTQSMSKTIFGAPVNGAGKTKQ